MSEEQEDITTVDFKVYDVPVELKNKYISMAKLDYDNQMWKVLEAGMDALMEERQRKVPELETQVDQLQQQIAYLKVKIEDLEGTDLNKEDDNGPPKTFGSPEEKEESDEELLNRFSSK